MPGRNIARALVAPVAILNMLHGSFPDDRDVHLPVFRIEGVPDGCKVLSVHYEPDRMVFSFTLKHPSFGEVPEGEIIPTLPGMYSIVRCQGGKATVINSWRDRPAMF